MLIIKPNCRNHLTATDLDFILESLGDKLNRTALESLLAEPDSRDLILDDPDLRTAIQDRASLSPISAYLYFYVLVRHEFLEFGIDDRALADYTAEMLAEYSDSESIQSRLPAAARSEYLIDLMTAVQDADRQTAFQIRAHVGNHTLLMSGIFPARIQARTERRGAPGIEYYEQMGASHFRMASIDPLAERHDLSGVLSTLSERFHDTRVALNDMAERYLSLKEDPEIAKLLAAI